ncbi:MAG: hypothetical protein QOH28_32 [Actinomycetota bacterium]|jgi:hypothetical protein|nr:hypothetical protein [Actinomycetota bacterium]
MEPDRGERTSRCSSRAPSIADVQHNGLGGLLGALLAWLLFGLLKPYKQPMVA